MTVDRIGRFDRERALEQGIPMKLWSRLQKGEVIEQDGRTYTPDMVLGAPRRGLKVTYCTDTRPVEVSLLLVKVQLHSPAVPGRHRILENLPHVLEIVLRMGQGGAVMGEPQLRDLRRPR